MFTIKGIKPLSNFCLMLQIILMLLASYVLAPLAWILKKTGWRFINIDLSQIGSPVYLDLLIREDILTRGTPRYKMLALASHYFDGNKYLNDLYAPYVTLVRNPFIKFLLSPFFVSDVFDDNSFRYDFVVHRATVAHDIWERYLQKTGGRHLISFPKKDEPEMKEQLARYIPADKPFVAFHVRDSGFYNDPERITRNADIFTYQSAVQYMIDRGYAVVRMGDASATNIDKMIDDCEPMLFDYAHSDIHSDKMDCYLLSHCAFFLGLASGPSSVPMLFGVNSLNINWHNASNSTNFIPGDLTTFKKFRWRKTGKLIPFERIMLPPFSMNATLGQLERYDALLENNSEEEILETVKEFLDKRPPTERQQKAKNLVRPENYGYGAKGYASDTVLKQYFD